MSYINYTFRCMIIDASKVLFYNWNANCVIWASLGYKVSNPVFISKMVYLAWYLWTTISSTKGIKPGLVVLLFTRSISITMLLSRQVDDSSLEIAQVGRSEACDFLRPQTPLTCEKNLTKGVVGQFFYIKLMRLDLAHCYFGLENICI